MEKSKHEIARFRKRQMKSRVSKRRWKARFWLGRWIPWFAIVDHRLKFPALSYQYNPAFDAIRKLEHVS